MLPLLTALSMILPVLFWRSVYLRSMAACLHPPETYSPPSVMPQSGHCMVLLCWHLNAILLLHSVPNLQFSAVLRARLMCDGCMGEEAGTDGTSVCHGFDPLPFMP